MNIASLSASSSSPLSSAGASSAAAVQPAELSSTGHDMAASCNNPGCNCAGGVAAAAQLRTGGSVNLSSQGYALLQGAQGAGLANLLDNAVSPVEETAAGNGAAANGAAANATPFVASQALQAYREPAETNAPLSALAALA